MTDLENLRRRVEVYKLIVARSCVDEAAEIAQLVSGLSVEHPLFRSLHAAMIISYGRAFSEMKPFAMLPAKWERFDDPQDQRVHDILMGHRNKSVGHADHIPKKVVIYPEGARMHNGEIAPRVQTEILTSYMVPEDFRYIQKMARGLERRMAVAISDQLTVLYGEEGVGLRETIELITDEDVEIWKSMAKKNAK